MSNFVGQIKQKFNVMTNRAKEFLGSKGTPKYMFYSAFSSFVFGMKLDSTIELASMGASASQILANAALSTALGVSTLYNFNRGVKLLPKYSATSDDAREDFGITCACLAVSGMALHFGLVAPLEKFPIATGASLFVGGMFAAVGYGFFNDRLRLMRKAASSAKP